MNTSFCLLRLPQLVLEKMCSSVTLQFLPIQSRQLSSASCPLLMTKRLKRWILGGDSSTSDSHLCSRATSHLQGFCFGNSFQILSDNCPVPSVYLICVGHCLQLVNNWLWPLSCSVLLSCMLHFDSAFWQCILTVQFDSAF